MQIPKYIKEILSRSDFYYGPGSKPGYTIRIHKKTEFTYVNTLVKEANNLVSWVKRQMPKDYPWDNSPVADIEKIPDRTRYCDQVAIVTVTDPIMKHIESFIRDKK